MKTNAWFLLYGGTSEDGRGPGHFVKRTERPSEARAHYEECRENPYSVGRVDIVTDDCIECAGMLTDWSAYSIAEKRECCCGETDDAWRLCPEHGPSPEPPEVQS